MNVSNKRKCNVNVKIVPNDVNAVRLFNVKTG